jgi:glycosyltransferase involved in cell wall biosynthesis
LLEAFKDFAFVNKDWRLVVIGPIEDAFQSCIKEYFELYPNLIDRVLFTGAITDRIALEDKYNSAKIFVLTSRFEGFPLVFLEAIRSGCTIISSSIASAYDITDNEKYGALFPVGDAKTLAKELDKAVNNVIKLKNDCKDIQQFAYEKYSWSKISIRINELIQG